MGEKKFNDGVLYAVKEDGTYIKLGPIADAKITSVSEENTEPITFDKEKTFTFQLALPLKKFISIFTVKRTNTLLSRNRRARGRTKKLGDRH